MILWKLFDRNEYIFPAFLSFACSTFAVGLYSYVFAVGSATDAYTFFITFFFTYVVAKVATFSVWIALSLLFLIILKTSFSRRKSNITLDDFFFSLGTFLFFDIFFFILLFLISTLFYFIA